MKKFKIGLFAGSIRKGSYSKTIAEWLTQQMNDQIEWQLIQIGDLPLYNQDYDEITIDSYDRFRADVNESDAILFVTPEYNRSIPPVLKNALDIASRPYGNSVWTKKPAAIVSQSISNIGGSYANQHLRQILNALNVFVMQQPECYVTNSSMCIDENGQIAEKTQDYLTTYLTAYLQWVKQFVK